MEMREIKKGRRGGKRGEGGGEKKREGWGVERVRRGERERRKEEGEVHLETQSECVREREFVFCRAGVDGPRFFHLLLSHSVFL